MSEAVHGPVHGSLRLGALGDVGFDDQRRAAGFFDLGGEGRQAVPAPGHERHGGA